MNTQIDLAQLLSKMGDAVVVADRQGKIVLWNPAATRLFGFSEDEMVGHDLTLIIPERLRQRHNVGFDGSMATGTTRYGSQLLKVPALHKDGRTLSIAFTVAMLVDAQDKVTAIAAVIRDETERFQAERALAKRLAACEAKTQTTAAAASQPD
jgi:PAS domain S-box-containing protein